MKVYAKMRLKQQDGTIKEETYNWRDYEVEADLVNSHGLGYYSIDSSKAFKTFLKYKDVIIPACCLQNLVAIKFYDEANAKNANWDGGWLYLPQNS